MATVTSARVLFRRVVQPEEYESKSAEVEFSFTFDEEEKELVEEVTADMMELAKNQVLTAVGLRKK